MLYNGWRLPDISGGERGRRAGRVTSREGTVAIHRKALQQREHTGDSHDNHDNDVDRNGHDRWHIPGVFGSFPDTDELQQVFRAPQGILPGTSGVRVSHPQFPGRGLHGRVRNTGCACQGMHAAGSERILCGELSEIHRILVPYPPCCRGLEAREIRWFTGEMM